MAKRLGGGTQTKKYLELGEKATAETQSGCGRGDVAGRIVRGSQTMTVRSIDPVARGRLNSLNKMEGVEPVARYFSSTEESMHLMAFLCAVAGWPED